MTDRLPISEVLPTLDPDLCLDSYDYDLPPERIAQTPLTPRDRCRLLTVQADSWADHYFFELGQLLQPGDLLVLNDTRVIPARLLGIKLGGSNLAIEVLLLEERSDRQWLALVKPGRRLRPGSKIQIGELTATIQATDPTTRGRFIEFDLPSGERLWPYLEHLGRIPLPPYICQPLEDHEQYQTIYSKHPGAVAAPTAGLHFTPELLQGLTAKGIHHSFITLHVGVGTFRPVESRDIRGHQLHHEWLQIPETTVAQIQRCHAQGGRVIAVGTTVVRALETAAQTGTLQAFSGLSDLFIYPGYRPKIVDGLITNFHLPRSSLLLLVSAFIGRERLLELYQWAIAQEYRFYSFGDAMLILPEACCFS
ncbi:tRNA preQ1(34) S-adenosylmethionine ribosyltransferase-isomerase QueA [Candidatus Synechococcus calcipolaris G9]|uniref:S-adenosylmethionine:tRNA ribosyltransferase-isomerase n=1 Tax=Candidatus Synechococcus calcipolaris G9 TaxID=1497997 RepID=A0ABT6EY10_9SYNE|nr:tRNA preQ1(34) S-adenosylmethionine ribosyltransferase-isomerase QueA [Candidatus Synechococcus calcipolaris]MDG2990262.1 tRNA preQ1(34) S-adenosylmethionine ribosyltransferase-isomerase QueA [Candidatus Synechococcus calcipolaris G9]